MLFGYLGTQNKSNQNGNKLRIAIQFVTLSAIAPNSRPLGNVLHRRATPYPL